MNKSIYEPLCWNCAKAHKIKNEKNEILFYEPCDLYRLKMACRYIPDVKIVCSNCQKYEPSVGCLSGYSLGNGNCNFTLKDEHRQMSIDSQEQLRRDICYICPLRRISLDNLKERCFDCPIRWEKMGINFKLR
jgi:hypothetical protein